MHHSGISKTKTNQRLQNQSGKQMTFKGAAATLKLALLQ